MELPIVLHSSPRSSIIPGKSAKMRTTDGSLGSSNRASWEMLRTGIWGSTKLPGKVGSFSVPHYWLDSRWLDRREQPLCVLQMEKN